MNLSPSKASQPALRYLLRVADTCLIHAQRLAEWCGHAPVLEEDIALTNIALDQIGQARAVFAHVAALEGAGRSEDDLAFLRIEREYLNPTLVELPRGDFAVTSLRNLFVATFQTLLWSALRDSKDSEVAAIAGKSIKEALYHQRHAADWCVRLGQGTEESQRRMSAALELLWPYVPELFESSAEDLEAVHTGLGPDWSSLEGEWRQEVQRVLDEAGLAPPAPSRFRSSGRLGRHSEHMGFLLAELQYLQRAVPEGRW